MNEIDFIIILLALALGIPAGYGLTYLIAWLIVEHQDKNEKMRRHMSPSSYRSHRRNRTIFIGIAVVLLIITPILYCYYLGFAFETSP